MNRYWMIFLAFVGLVALWHSVKGGNELYKYYTLSKSAVASSIKITTKEFSNGRFGGNASYSFTLGNQLFSGETFLEDPIFRNREAMDSNIPRLEAQKWRIWFQPSNPLNSALSKVFPFKEVIYSIILWGLLFYFVWLGYYTK